MQAKFKVQVIGEILQSYVKNNASNWLKSEGKVEKVSYSILVE